MRRLVAVFTLVFVTAGMPATGTSEESSSLEDELKGYVESALASSEVGAKRAGLLAWGQFADGEARKQIADYKSDDAFAVRLAAGVALVEAGDAEAKSFLVEQLATKSDLYRVFRDQLAVAPTDLQVELVEKLIESKKSSAEKSLFRYLAKQYGPLYELLTDYATSDNEDLRGAALQALRATASVRAFAVVDELQSSDDASVQKQGLDLAVTLSKYPGRRDDSVEALKPFLEADDAALAHRAAERLLELEEKSGVDRLLTILEESDSEKLKQKAGRTLLEHRISPPADRVKPLYKKAEEDPLEQIYLELAVASGDEETFEKLEKMFGSTKFDKRLVAAKALGRSDNSKAVDLLSKALFEGNPKMRLAAARSLRQIADPASLSALERAVGRERNEKVKVEVIGALGAVGSKKAGRILRFNSRTKKPVFKQAIVEAVREAGRADGVETLRLFRSARDLDLQWKAFLATLDIAPKKAMGRLESMFRNPPDGFARDLRDLDLSTQKLVYKRLLRFENDRVRRKIRQNAQRTGEPFRSLLREAVIDDEVPASTRRALVVHFAELGAEEDRPRIANVVSNASETSLVRRAAWALTKYDGEGLEANFRGYIAKDDPVLKAIGGFGLAAIKL